MPAPGLKNGFRDPIPAPGALPPTVPLPLAKAPESPPQPGHHLGGPLRSSLASEAGDKTYLL